MVLPERALDTVVRPPGARIPVGYADPQHDDIAQRSARYAGHEPARRHRVDPEVIDLLPRLSRPQQHLAQVADPLHAVRPSVDRVAWHTGQQSDVRLGETDNVRTFPFDTAQDFVAAALRPGRAHSTFQFTTVMTTLFLGTLTWRKF